MVDTQLDIDIWGYGRDAAQAGRLTTKMLKACYPFIEAGDGRMQRKLMAAVRGHLEHNHAGQEQFLVRENYVFFQSKEDMQFVRALLYVI